MSIVSEGRWVIGQVSYDGIKPWTRDSLWELASSLQQDGHPLPMMASCDHTYITPARQIVAEQVLSVPPEVIDLEGILWIDADMKFAPWDVKEILKYAEDIPYAVIGAVYPARRSEGMVGKFIEDKNSRYFPLQDAYELGFGFVWTPRTCFNLMRKPWFEEPWDRDTGHFTGEDINFCRKWRKLNHPVLAYESATVMHEYSPGPRPLTKENRGGVPSIKVW